MSDELEAKLARNAFLQRLDRLVAKFDDAPAVHIDQVIVVATRGLFIASALVAEIVALENAFLLEELQGAVDRGQRDAAVDPVGAQVDLLDVGVVFGARQNAGNNAPLP